MRIFRAAKAAIAVTVCLVASTICATASAQTDMAMQSFRQHRGVTVVQAVDGERFYEGRSAGQSSSDFALASPYQKGDTALDGVGH